MKSAYQRFVSAVAHNDARTFCASLTPGGVAGRAERRTAQAQCTRELSRPRAFERLGAAQATSGTSIEEIKVTGDKATARIKGGQAPGQAEFRKVDGSWRLVVMPR